MDLAELIRSPSDNKGDDKDVADKPRMMFHNLNKATPLNSELTRCDLS